MTQCIVTDSERSGIYGVGDSLEEAVADAVGSFGEIQGFVCLHCIEAQEGGDDD